MTTFNVLNYDGFKKEIQTYDVLPYFRNMWKAGSFKAKSIKTKEELKKWIEGTSRYMFWARCEYEFLMASWPFGSLKMHENIQEFFKEPKDMSNYSNKIDLENIITSDMEKIDIHQQIEMNLDIITDILYKEFRPDSAAKFYRLKHVPTGLYYRPTKRGNLNLDERGEVYKNNHNGLSGHKTHIHLSISNKQAELFPDTEVHVRREGGKFVVVPVTDFEREYI